MVTSVPHRKRLFHPSFILQATPTTSTTPLSGFRTCRNAVIRNPLDKEAPSIALLLGTSIDLSISSRIVMRVKAKEGGDGLLYSRRCRVELSGRAKEECRTLGRRRRAMNQSVCLGNPTNASSFVDSCYCRGSRGQTLVCESISKSRTLNNK